MSSEIFSFEDSFLCDSFSSFTEDSSTIDPLSHEILQENSLLFDEVNTFDQTAPTLLSSSPSSRVNLENLSLSHLGNEEYSVKKEEYPIPISLEDKFENSSYDEKLIIMQSYGSNCNSFDAKGQRNLLFYPPGVDGILLESQNQVLNSPESGFSYSQQIRRVCSTGDLQKMKRNMETRNVLSSSPLSTDRSFMVMEEPNFKVARYSAPERKERIDRYRAKRTQRNFNKTIKYACRKTLADSRARVRGRFARNDEGGVIPKASLFNIRCVGDDDDDLWVDGFLEQEDEGLIARGSFLDKLSSTQYYNNSYRH